MKKFIKAKPKDTIGSGFDGYLLMPYDHLVFHLGEPHDCTKDGPWCSHDWKTRAMWAFKSRNKKPTVITIYDYKEIMPIKGIRVWHVGIKGDERRFYDFFEENKLKYPVENCEQGE
jgi:hypothetical protein